MDVYKTEYTTPIGVVNFANIADEGYVNYGKARYVVSLNCALSDPATPEFMKKISAHYKDFHAKQLTFKSVGISFSNEAGDVKREDGSKYTDKDATHISIWAQNDVETQWGPRKILLYDGQGKKINGNVNIGKGSTVRVSGVARYYTSAGSDGIVLYLKKVQVIHLVPYEDNSFEAVSDASFLLSETGKPMVIPEKKPTQKRVVVGKKAEQIESNNVINAGSSEETLEDDIPF